MNASESSARVETDDAPAETPRGIQDLGELLAVDEPSEQDTPSGDDEQRQGESQKKTKLTRFLDLSESTGMEADALYSLEVSIEDLDEPVTVGQLKDAYKLKAQNDLDRIAFEEQRAEQQQELLREKRELEEILSALPKNAVRPEVLERIRARHEAQVSAEREKALQVMPEWKDAERRSADIQGMVDHLGAYGLPKELLTTVPSHQFLKYVRDNWQREQRMKRALEAVRAGKPDKRPAPKPEAKGKAPRRNPLPPSRGRGHDRLLETFSTVD